MAEVKLGKVWVSNFLSFAEAQEVDFSTFGDSPVLVRGENGAGKSALLEAVYWCLTGRLVREMPVANVVRFGANICAVDVCLTFGEQEIHVRRRWTRKGPDMSVVIKGSGTDGRPNEAFSGDPNAVLGHSAADTTKRLLAYVGIDADVMALTMFFGSRFDSLSQLKPASRAELLDILSYSERWEACRFMARSLHADYKSDYEKAEAKLKLLDAQLETTARNVKALKARLNELSKQSKAKADSLKTELAELHRQDEAGIKAIDEATANLERVMREIHRDKQQENALWEQRESLSLSVAQNEARRKTIADLIRHDHCPTCSAPITDEAREQGRYELGALDGEIERDGDKIYQLNEELNAVTARIETLVGYRSGYTSSIDVLRAQRVQRDRLRGRLEQQIKEIEGDAALATVQDEYNKRLHQLNDLKLARYQTGQERTEANTNFRAAAFWIEGFKSIRHQLIERSCAYLGRYITAYSKQLGLTVDAIVARTRTEAGRPQVYFSAVVDGRELPISGLSEGQLRRVDLAAFASFNQLVAQATGHGFAVLVFDEPNHGLSADGRHKAFEFISGLKGQKVVIDHDAHFQHRFEHEITVTRSNGASYIEVAR
ncbi:MAG TPA: AAA family ATPase [Gammaproteobacteria bacterium]|nr:AAA family ATPase [Gammaproteobacteria bacterium]